MAVNADGSINAVVTATELDIRDISNITDSITSYQGGSWVIDSITGTVNVQATELDIRALAHNSIVPDSVQIGDGTEVLAINADGSINATVSATDLDIRDLTQADQITAFQGGTWAVDVSNTVTVQATDLDVRDLSHTQDSIQIGDGLDILAVNADGSINAVVSGTDIDIRDLSAAQDSVQSNLFDGAGTALTSTLVGASQALDVNVVSSQSAAQFQYAIADISWEKTESYNIGIDANFFNYKFFLFFDYYFYYIIESL
jgi:acylphosphatase